MRGRRAGHGVGAGGAGGRACALTSWGFMEGRAGPGGFSKEVALEPALEAGGGSHGGASWKMDGRERGLRAGKGVAEVEQRSQADSCFHNPQRRPLPTTAGRGLRLDLVAVGWGMPEQSWVPGLRLKPFICASTHLQPSSHPPAHLPFPPSNTQQSHLWASPAMFCRGWGAGIKWLV